MYFILGLGFIVLLFKFPVFMGLAVATLCLLIAGYTILDLFPKRKIDAATPSKLSSIAAADIRLNFNPKRLP